METPSSPTPFLSFSLGGTDVSGALTPHDSEIDTLQLGMTIVDTSRRVADAKGSPSHQRIARLENQMKKVRIIRKKYERALAQVETQLTWECNYQMAHGGTQT